MASLTGLTYRPQRDALMSCPLSGLSSLGTAANSGRDAHNLAEPGNPDVVEVFMRILATDLWGGAVVAASVMAYLTY